MPIRSLNYIKRHATCIPHDQSPIHFVYPSKTLLTHILPIPCHVYSIRLHNVWSRANGDLPHPSPHFLGHLRLLCSFLYLTDACIFAIANIPQANVQLHVNYKLSHKCRSNLDRLPTQIAPPFSKTTSS